MACVLGSTLFTADLAILAAAYSLPSILGTVFLTAKYWRVRQGVSLRADQDPARVSSRVILGYSGPLIVWSACVLAVNGLGTSLVGALDFAGVATFAVATSMALAVSGFSNAAIAPLLPELSSTLDRQGFRKLLAQSTRVNALLLLACCVGSWAIGLFVLAGSDGLASTQTSIATVLLVPLAMTIRLTMTPLSMAFIARGTHHRVIFPPLADAMITVVLSVVLGRHFGALGVAGAQVFGAFVAVILTCTWSARRAGLQEDLALPEILQVLGRLSVCLAVTAGCLVFLTDYGSHALTRIAVSALCMLLCVGCGAFLLLRKQVVVAVTKNVMSRRHCGSP
ncbi:hypothetical protein [Nocardioides solisilvae]|uniref:hypothetical protein n=1 Tax=Nocardioides solisilvae TaxID=1542435 RepID=UPI0013A5658F|nr:hypothetical protein [Nocardioides solisilvae]